VLACKIRSVLSTTSGDSILADNEARFLLRGLCVLLLRPPDDTSEPEHLTGEAEALKTARELTPRLFRDSDGSGSLLASTVCDVLALLATRYEAVFKELCGAVQVVLPSGVELQQGSGGSVPAAAAAAAAAAAGAGSMVSNLVARLVERSSPSRRARLAEAVLAPAFAAARHDQASVRRFGLLHVAAPVMRGLYGASSMAEDLSGDAEESETDTSVTEHTAAAWSAISLLWVSGERSRQGLGMACLCSMWTALSSRGGVLAGGGPYI